MKHEAFLSNQATVSFTLNTGGVALYRSSTVSIWPVWLVVNELPPQERYGSALLLIMCKIILCSCM